MALLLSYIGSDDTEGLSAHEETADRPNRMLERGVPRVLKIVGTDLNRAVLGPKDLVHFLAC